MTVRTVDQAFVVFHERIMPTATARNAAVSHRASVKAALENRLDVLRSFESGSFTNGTSIRGASDVDLFVSLAGDRPTSDTALWRVKQALSNRFPHTSVAVRRPAVAIQFGQGLETWEITPAFLVGKKGGHMLYDIPGHTTGWMRSSPEAHIEFVKHANASPKGKAKELARLAKAWKYLNDVPISSIYLEMRAAQYVNGISTYIAVWDLCALLERLHSIQLASMNDPMGLSTRLVACSTEAKGAAALSRLNTAAVRARKALDAYRNGDEPTAFDYLDLLFNGSFPARIY